MKKFLSSILVILVVFTLFVGCNKKPETSEIESTTKAETASITVIINENSFTDNFDETAFYEELDAIEGVFHTKNTETNEYTLTMTETAFKELKNVKSKPVIDAFNGLIKDAENFVTDIKYDSDFRNVKVYAQKDKVPEELSDYDATLLKIMSPAMAYQIYTVEGQRVNITVINSESEEVLKTVSYPVVIQ